MFWWAKEQASLTLITQGRSGVCLISRGSLRAMQYHHRWLTWTWLACIWLVFDCDVYLACTWLVLGFTWLACMCLACMWLVLGLDLACTWLACTWLVCDLYLAYPWLARPTCSHVTYPYWFSSFLPWVALIMHPCVVCPHILHAAPPLPCQGTCVCEFNLFSSPPAAIGPRCCCSGAWVTTLEVLRLWRLVIKTKGHCMTAYLVKQHGVQWRDDTW